MSLSSPASSPLAGEEDFYLIPSDGPEDAVPSPPPQDYAKLIYPILPTAAGEESSGRPLVPPKNEHHQHPPLVSRSWRQLLLLASFAAAVLGLILLLQYGIGGLLLRKQLCSLCQCPGAAPDPSGRQSIRVLLVKDCPAPLVSALSPSPHGSWKDSFSYHVRE